VKSKYTLDEKGKVINELGYEEEKLKYLKKNYTR